MGKGGARTRSSAAAASNSGNAGDDPFQVGFAISVWQNSGDQSKEASNWGIFERQRTWLGQPTIWHGDKCGASCDFWNRYEEDLERARTLGSNCFRLSLEWHRIEPAKGQIDQAAVQRYHDMFECMKSKGLEPHVTLHHFVHPAWFEKLGGFAKEENIAHFLDYTRTALELFGKHAKYWATFNEPGVTSFAGHIYGSFPPGRIGSVAGHARHMLCMLRAHTQAYELIKSMPGCADKQVGIVWNYFWFEPKRSSWWTPFYLPWISRLLTRVWGNDIFIQYLRTGEFDWNPLPWVFSRVHFQEPKGRPGCDFIGLNYYSRGVMDWKLSPTCNAGEVMTDMPYSLLSLPRLKCQTSTHAPALAPATLPLTLVCGLPVSLPCLCCSYAEGLLLAIHHLSKVGVPIYITETGVADTGDERRPLMIQSYMEQVERAVELGYDLRGVMYWTLVDNFEWGFGYSMRFGVYRWENDGSQKRVARKSAALLKSWYDKLPGRIAQLLEKRQQTGGAAAAADEAEPALQPVAA